MDVTARRWSYSSTKMGTTNRLNELYQLFRITRRGPERGVAMTLDSFRKTTSRIEKLTERRLEGLKVLDIGPGQQLRHMHCFSLKNDVLGIDTDVIPHGLRVGEYAHMVRHNTWIRTMKTLIRKGIGRDRDFRAALARALGVDSLRRLKVLRMSATNMTFTNSMFDAVLSYSAFEHIDDPLAALQEIRRVLKPGGVAYISIHVYTSHSGNHDPSIMRAGTPLPPYWPHLRPAFKDATHPSAYINYITVPRWKEMFAEVMPGVQFVHEKQEKELRQPLKELRAAGELADYTDEELLTLNLIGVWMKPLLGEREEGDALCKKPSFIQSSS